MHFLRAFCLLMALSSALSLFGQKPRMTSVIPDSIKKITDKFILQFITKSRYDSCIVFDAKESWGAGYLSKAKKDTSWSFDVRYKFVIPGKEKAVYAFYFNIIEGRITNNKNPFPACVTKGGRIAIISLDQAKEILFRHNVNYKKNWNKVTVRLGMNDCFTWVFTYKDDAPSNAPPVPSSSLHHKVTIHAVTGEIIPETARNN
jgi:hypothetical protein